MKVLVLISWILLVVLAAGCTAPSPQSPTQNSTVPEGPSANLVSAAEAQESVESVLEAVLGSRNAEGVTVPTDVEVGPAELITKDGIQVWDIPVYVNGTRVGDGYVKQKRSPEGRLEASYNITVTGTRG